MSRQLNLEGRAADQILLAVEHGDFDGDAAAGDDVRGGSLRRPRHDIAERDAFGLGASEGFRRGVGAYDARAELGRTAGCLGEARRAPRDRPCRAWSAGR